MRRNDDRPILGKFTEEGSHPDPGCRVEADCRLIEQQHSRISDNCTRDSKPLAHSTRKRLDAIIGAVDKPHTIKGRTCRTQHSLGSTPRAHAAYSTALRMRKCNGRENRWGKNPTILRMVLTSSLTSTPFTRK
ncbi:hypothetical protein JCM18920_1172 [Cutibacterium acnes JCM 18920]|nr:hypothetical protein JCM18920_1172 [Cutibacterium acnes JCM 18920]